MSRLLLGRPSDSVISPATLASMFRFRFEIFHAKLGWQVATQGNQERDEYDDLNPYYLVSLDTDNKTNGCWRLLPTCGQYMIQDTFPELLRGESTPHKTNIWELSRFAVSASNGDQAGQIALNRITFRMMGELIDFADANNISHYVTAMSVAVERLMKKAGIPMQRFGDGKASRVGNTLSVASWIPINEELREVVGIANGTLHEEAA